VDYPITQATHQFKLDKLVRDHIPGILRCHDIEVFERVLETQEYLKRLKDKLLEEAREVVATKTPEEMRDELADLLEVIQTLSKAHDISMEEIEEIRLSKRQEKGGFDKQKYVAYIEMKSDNKHIAYYRTRSEEYPEIEAT
jgi:predicted house-cleaning noncanonical NTP pyrophosphatase (MazG superfamily)